VVAGEDARVNVAAISELAAGSRRRLLVDMRRMRSQTRDTRTHKPFDLDALLAYVAGLSRRPD